MKRDTEFDKALKLYEGKMPADIREALVVTVDTLDCCRLGCEAVFEKRASPKDVLVLLQVVMNEWPP